MNYEIVCLLFYNFHINNSYIYNLYINIIK